MKKTENNHKAKCSKGVFIDLFSGCGGLSLGLMSAGWNGLFAVEKNPMAFETLRYNLIDGENFNFSWPGWLEKAPMSVEWLLKKHGEDLAALNGNIDLVAGGPPCQGFSLAGKRNPNDPRNKLMGEYLKVVKLVKPRFLLIENVRGFNSVFYNSPSITPGSRPGLNTGGRGTSKPYAEIVAEKLDDLGYKVFSKPMTASEFGVPQARSRFFMIAAIKNDLSFLKFGNLSPFEIMYESRENFLVEKGLGTNKPIPVKDAISDLQTRNKKLIPSTDSPVKGFLQINYIEPGNLTPYQRLLRAGSNGNIPNSLRLARHQPRTIDFFKKIQGTCLKGRYLNLADKKRLGIRKQAIHPLAAGKPSPTITTLPDDILHYSEPRILTVRENARLQSFPDWFAFQGNYTTGNTMRRKECPRYTQVGNAVPPLLAEIIGKTLSRMAF